MTTELSIFDPVSRELYELAEYSRSLHFDYESKEGNKLARSHVAKLRKVKAHITDAHKEAKAEALAVCQALDAKKRELMDIAEKMIDVHAGPLEAIEAREKRRVEEIETALRDIVTEGERCEAGWKNIPIEELERCIVSVCNMNRTMEWQEYSEKAKEALDRCVERINNAIRGKMEYEAQQEELKRMREENERLEREKRDAEIARQAEERARREERERAELELQREREKSEREAKEAKEKADRALQEERERVAREQAMKEEEERKAAAEAKRKEDEEAARIADEEHRAKIHEEIRKDVYRVLNSDCVAAKKVLDALVCAEIRHITIKY